MEFEVGQEVIIDDRSPGVVVEPGDSRFPNSDSMVWVLLAGAEFPLYIHVSGIQLVNEHPCSDKECEKLVAAEQVKNVPTAAAYAVPENLTKNSDQIFIDQLKECVDTLAKDNCSLSNDCASLAELVKYYKYKISTQSEIAKLQVNLGNVEEQINKLSPVFEKHVLPF